MNKRKLCSLTAALVMSWAAALYPAGAAAADTHKVTVLDFNGNEMAVLEFEDGAELDLSSVDVSQLSGHIDDYTEIRFNTWSSHPETVTEDVTVQALFVQMTISCDSQPTKTEYYHNSGSIRTDGLEVSITVLTQTPELDEKGNYIVEHAVVPIESKCTTVPSTADEAFRTGRDTASVYVYPPGSRRSVCVYDIHFYSGLGDIDGDGKVDATDASKMLVIYSKVSTGKMEEPDEELRLKADIDRNGKIDASDASFTLSYYAKNSTSNDFVSWDEFLGK